MDVVSKVNVFVGSAAKADVTVMAAMDTIMIAASSTAWIFLNISVNFLSDLFFYKYYTHL